MIMIMIRKRIQSPLIDVLDASYSNVEWQMANITSSDVNTDNEAIQTEIVFSQPGKIWLKWFSATQVLFIVCIFILLSLPFNLYPVNYYGLN